MPVFPLNANQGQHTASLKVGDSITFAIEENPGTGYRWEASAPSNSSVSISSDFVVGGAGRPGASGERRIMLMGQAPGQTTIYLDLRRSWDPPSQYQNRIALSIEVRS